MESQQRGTRK